MQWPYIGYRSRTGSCPDSPTLFLVDSTESSAAAGELEAAAAAGELEAARRLITDRPANRKTWRMKRTPGFGANGPSTRLRTTG
jgi:hypothetical protein